MEVEIKKISALKRKIIVNLKGEEFLKEKKEHYREVGKNLKVPGFRPGQAPLEVLEKFHKRILNEELIKRLIPSLYKKAVEENNLFPVSLPQIYDVKLNDKEISFSADLEIRPQVNVDNSLYCGLKLKDRKVEVEDKEIEKAIEDLKNRIKKITGKDETNDFYRWVGYPDEEFLRQAIRTELYLHKLRERRIALETQIINYLLEKINFEIPETELEAHTKELLDREIYNLRLKNIPEEDIEKYKKDIEERVKKVAFDEVKLVYILEAILKTENLKVEGNLLETVLGFILSKATLSLLV